MFKQLQQAVAQGLLRNVDYYFAQQIHQLAADGKPDDYDEPNLLLAAALVSASVGEGHVCLDLNAITDTTLSTNEGSAMGLTIPSLDSLVETLRQSSVVGGPGDHAPLILDASLRLYLGRYWWFEQQVADALLARAVPTETDEVNPILLKNSLQRMFSPKEGETDWQMVAAAMAVLRRFAVISGGPGTGKTHTVTSILALLVEQSEGKHINIALAAPTGKAAARLTESIRHAKPAINCSDAVRSQMPEEAATIHRLLGVRPGKVEPRHHAGNPLRVDLLVIDEASMIDLPLMARLLSALPEHARLILLGDKDQLASVETGNVFADISGERPGNRYTEAFLEQLTVSTGQALSVDSGGNCFSDCVALLRKSYRFDGETGIGLLASAVNAGESDSALELLKSGTDGVSYSSHGVGELYSALAQIVAKEYASGFSFESPREAIERFNAFRILCAVRGGPGGVEQVNRSVEEILRSSGHIHTSGVHYQGRPVMVARNDYTLGLFNGDVGIIWPDPESAGELRAWFILPDGTMKCVLPSRLPDHETAFAMTVHKAQGSEFERVLMLLPPEQSEVLTRELFYTGITRAKRQVEVWGSDRITKQCIESKVVRLTGLAEKLYV